MIFKMKKLMFIGALLTMVSGMYAQEAVKVSDFELKAGETKTVEIELVNTNAYCQGQFVITLPEGVTIPDYENDDEEMVPDVQLTSRKKSDHTVTTKLKSPGVWGVVIVSVSNKTFKGNDGALVTFKVKAADDLTGGVLTGKIGEILFAGEGVESNIADVTFNITSTSGINEISAEKPATVYDLKGNQIRKNATSVEGLAKGVYIINNKKVIVK
jgi:hypothetical protein